MAVADSRADKHDTLERRTGGEWEVEEKLNNGVQKRERLWGLWRREKGCWIRDVDSGVLEEDEKKEVEGRGEKRV